MLRKFISFFKAFLPDTKKLRENVTGILNAYEVQQEVLSSEGPKQNLVQRSSAPAVLDSSMVTTRENRLAEPAILGGSQSGTSQLQVKGAKSTKRSPRSPRRLKILPLKRLDKRTNGIVPAADTEIVRNGHVVKERKSSSNDELTSQSIMDSSPPKRLITAMHRKMVGHNW